MGFSTGIAVDEDRQLPDPVRARIAANLVDQETPEGEALSATIGTVAVVRGEQLVDARDYGDLTAGAGAAAANTATITAALASSDGDVLIPAGEWHVTPGVITVPSGRYLKGVRSAKYYGSVLILGTRLVSASTSGSGQILFLDTLARVTDIAISGPRGAVAYDGIKLSDSSVVERVVVRGCRDGINGNFSNAVTIRDINLFLNTRYGLRDIVDSLVDAGYINANDGDGISLGAGANDNVIRPTKVEWNNGHGVGLFNNFNNLIATTIIDRNGKTGVSAISTTKTTIGPVIVRRNGRLSGAVADADAHFFLQGNTALTLLAPLSATGADDDGAGYISPRYFSRESGNTALNIVGGDLGGATEPTKRSITSANVSAYESATTGNPYFDRRPAGRTAYWAGTVIAGGTGVMTVSLPPLATFALGDITDVQVALRNPSTGGRASARVPIVRTREGGAAVVTVGAVSNIVGTVVGSTITITAAVNTDASTLTVTVTNGETTDRAIALSV